MPTHKLLCDLDVGGNTTATKASDTRIESKATTAGAYFRANSAANGYFGVELFHDTTAKWFVGSYADNSGLSTTDFAIVSGSKGSGNVRFKIDSSGDATFSGKVVTTEIEGSSILLDSAADIELNCDGADVILKDATTEFGRFKNDSSDFVIKSAVNDKDMIFKGVDNSSAITALTLDMSDAGTAIFNHDIKIPSGGIINFNSGDVTLTHSSNALTVAGGTFTTANLTTTGVVTLAADNHVIEDGGALVDDSANALMNFNGGEVMVDAKLIAKKHKLSKTSSTDADADGDIVYFGSTTSMDAGKIYYFTSSGTWALADADAESTAKGMLAVALGAASNTNGMLIRGMVTLDTDPGTIGDTLFLSTTAGVATSTAPSGNGDIVRVIGYCLDSTNGQIYFNPDGTFVEVTA